MTLDELRTRHRDFILSTATEHGVSDVRVFGSVARGEASEGSDVDLLVKRHDGTSLLKLVGLEQELGDRIGIPVQVITESGVSPLLKDRIFSEAQPL